MLVKGTLINWPCSKYSKKTQWRIRAMEGNPGQSWILDSTRWILDFRYWMPVFFFGTWIPDSNRYGPINVKPTRGGGVGGGGWRAGHGVAIWHFSKNCRQTPCPRADHSGQLQPTFATQGWHCCPSQGWTQERHNRNFSKWNSAIFIYKRCCITKDTCSYYSCD